MGKRKIRCQIILFLTVLMIGLCSNGTYAEAASAKWKKACKAYRTYLTKNVSSNLSAYTSGSYSRRYKTESYKKAAAFLIVDMDRNGIPELITYHAMGYRLGNVYIYTYKGGKVVPVKNTRGSKATMDVSCPACGRYQIYKCSKNHLHLYWSGYPLFEQKAEHERVYRMSGGKVKLYMEKTKDPAYGNKYSINGKKVSSKKYKTERAKCKVKSSYSLQSNTSKNRTRYVK